MIREKIDLYNSDEYKCSVSTFVPNLQAYLHVDNKIRPAIIVIPGGGYSFVSASEAYLVAMAYYNFGYQAYVLTYTTNTLRKFAPIAMQPLKDLSRAVCEVRKRASIDNVNANNVAVIGFSAGGHLAASIAVHNNLSGIKLERDSDISNVPNACILSYPVITTGDFAHKDSFVSLFGKNACEEDLELMSLEKHVSVSTPPVFLWHTVTDAVVPVENSILFMKACKSANVLCEMHLYPKGEHGLSVANDAWKNEEMGDSDYVFEQLKLELSYLAKNGDKDICNEFLNLESVSTKQFANLFYKYGQKLGFRKQNRKMHSDMSIANWVEQSVTFLNKVYEKII